VTTGGGASRRRGRWTVGAVAVLSLLAGLAPPARAEVVSRPTTGGYPTFGLTVGHSCIHRLEGASAGWVELTAWSTPPGTRIEDATLLGLVGRHQWRSPQNQAHIVDAPQAYELWSGGSRGPLRTARIAPGERFRVAYTVRPDDSGRLIAAGNEQVEVRVVSDGGTALPVVQESCGWGATQLRGGVPAVQRKVDWPAARAAQNAAIANGLELPANWADEFTRVLFEVCGIGDNLEPPEDIEAYTMLEVDHGAPVTVGVLGDSITSQIRDELVADTRFNWVVASMCAGRIDQFLGENLEPGAPDLSFGLDAVLEADPDVVVVALGSVDARDVGSDPARSAIRMLQRLSSVPCPIWMNAFVGTTNHEWAAATHRFNQRLSERVSAQQTPLLDWSGAVLTSGLGSGMWIAPGPFDELHVTVPIGHQARVGMILSAIDQCTRPPALTTCVTGVWDVWNGHAFCEEISWLVQEAITTGYADFSFRPTDTVTRQSMAAFLHRLAGSPATPAPDPATFRDVGAAHPFFGEIEWLAGEGIAGGFADGRFGPGLEVSRQAMAAFLYRLAGRPAFTPPSHATFPDVPAGHPFFREIEWLANRGIAGGYSDGRFRPDASVTRQAMAAFLQRYAAL
jgi:hypothetical protein